MRIVIELKRGENAEVILNKLYKDTALQDTFSVNMVALSDGAPPAHDPARNPDPTSFPTVAKSSSAAPSSSSAKPAARAHLLEGYAAAVANVDQIVDLIKTSPSPAAAETALLSRRWSAQTVADMLARLPRPHPHPSRRRPPRRPHKKRRQNHRIPILPGASKSHPRPASRPPHRPGAAKKSKATTPTSSPKSSTSSPSSPTATKSTNSSPSNSKKSKNNSPTPPQRNHRRRRRNRH